MKFSSHEEYGLRCLLQVGRRGEGGSVTIPQISEAEGLSTAYVAKLMRMLRLGGFVRSVRGVDGGYSLAKSAEHVIVGDVLAVLGGRLFEDDFCDKHTGGDHSCAHTVDCTIRSLWETVQTAVDQVLRRTSLQDLLNREQAANGHPAELVHLSCPTTPPAA